MTQENDLARIAAMEISHDHLAAATDAGAPIASAESGHTDGPWRFEERNVASKGAEPAIVGYVYGRAHGSYSNTTYDTEIAVLYGDRPHRPSDGALIAAAPELLAACKQALQAFETTDAIDWNVLADAIAKAEGR